MSELRRNPLTGSWVIIAPERAVRPTDYRVDDGRVPPSACPFCPGNESASPGDVLRYGSSGQWLLRVVPNRYPALRVEARGDGTGVGPWDLMPGLGAHEVVIETPRHVTDPAEITDEEWRRTFSAWRDRLRDLSGDVRLAYCAVFRNQGALAGATLEHPHSQILALPVVPDDTQREHERAREHLRTRGRLLLDDMVREEVRDGSRVVEASGDVTTFCPYASRQAFETWIVSRRAGSHFDRASDEALTSVAEATARAVRRLGRAIDRIPFQLMVHSAPLRGPDDAAWRWHVRLLPAVTRPAGFEVMTGCNINATPPEEAAAYLRGLSPSTR